MTTYKTEPLTNLDTDRVIYRMSGNRFMEVMVHDADATNPYYEMLRVVDMGNPGDTPTALTEPFALPDDHPLNLSTAVRGIPTYDDNLNAINSNTQRPLYGCSVPMSSTEFLWFNNYNLYRYTYDEAGAGDIVYDGIITEVGGYLPAMISEGSSTNPDYLQYHTGVTRMGTSNSFMVIQEDTEFGVDATQEISTTLQVWAYDSSAKTITLTFSDTAPVATNRRIDVHNIPGSDNVFITYSDALVSEDVHAYEGNWLEFFRLDADGTKHSAVAAGANEIAFDAYKANSAHYPLPLDDNRVWWVRPNNTAIFKDYATDANTYTMTMEPGTAFLKTYANFGWAIDDKTFMMGRNQNNGLIQLMPVKHTGYGFGELSPNGQINVGTDTFVNNVADDHEAEFIRYITPNGSGDFGNALYAIDADTYRVSFMKDVTESTGDVTYNQSRIYHYDFKKSV